MRFRLKFWSLLLWAGVSLAYYPFFGEDAGTVGRQLGFELENNFTFFRYYNGVYHQDYVFQIAVGLSRNADLALFVPYSKFYNGESVEGLNDAGFYIKHIPYREKLKLGYMLQVNFDTGREGIGYGKTTANLHLIGEREFAGTTYNVNLVYIKSGHIEELRDSYGFVIGAFRDYRDSLSYGLELKVLNPEDRNVNVVDTHILAGVVYHRGNKDFSLGLHKTLTHHPSFVNYGILFGVLFSF